MILYLERLKEQGKIIDYQFKNGELYVRTIVPVERIEIKGVLVEEKEKGAEAPHSK